MRGPGDSVLGDDLKGGVDQQIAPGAVISPTGCR
jgi:hypothetical protein